MLPDLRQTIGYLVADAKGKIVGRVECTMYGRTRDTPDALSVRSGFLSRRRRLVPAETIQEIDGASGVVGLNVERESIRSFL
jgi:PH (Pleckstrin Homology) domain-containing protein